MGIGAEVFMKLISGKKLYAEYILGGSRVVASLYCSENPAKFAISVVSPQLGGENREFLLNFSKIAEPYHKINARERIIFGKSGAVPVVYQIEEGNEVCFYILSTEDNVYRATLAKKDYEQLYPAPILKVERGWIEDTSSAFFRATEAIRNESTRWIEYDDYMDVLLNDLPKLSQYATILEGVTCTTTT